jgi:Kef-type K+ transport system membrane component KefB
MWYELFTHDFLFAWCVSAAALLIEHWLCRPSKMPFWPRYVLGVAALLVGAYAYEHVSGLHASATILAALSTAGILIMALYGLDVRLKTLLKAAREAGILEGRAIEAARRAWKARRTGPGGD